LLGSAAIDDTSGTLAVDCARIYLDGLSAYVYSHFVLTLPIVDFFDFCVGVGDPSFPLVDSVNWTFLDVCSPMTANRDHADRLLLAYFVEILDVWSRFRCL
jgi:hypothetical protein